MAIYFGMSADSINSLFSSLDGSNQTNLSFLGNYASIKNGSYSKLLKSYYDLDKNEADNLQESPINSATNKKLQLLMNETKDLYKYSQELLSLNTEDEKYMKSLNNFVESYNSVITSADDTELPSVLRNVASMTNITASNSEMLERSGIQINADNTLSIDEEMFEKALASDKSTLFVGENSYISSILNRVTNVYTQVSTQLNKADTYQSTGAYTTINSTGSIYDSLF